MESTIKGRPCSCDYNHPFQPMQNSFSKEDYKPPKQTGFSPDFNKLCKPLTLFSNFFSLASFEMTNNKNGCIYCYSISFNPEIEADSRFLISSLILKCRKEIEESIGKFFWSGLNLFSDKECKAPQIYSAGKYELILKYCSRIDASSINNQKDVIIQNGLLAILDRQVKTLLKIKNYFEFGRTMKYFNLKDKVFVKELNISILMGFSSSFKACKDKIYLLVNSCNKIMREETVNTMLQGAKDTKKAESIIINHKVIALYGGNKIYTVSAIDYKKSPRSTFSYRGKEISFEEYYRNNYKMKVKDLNQPLLVIEDRNKQPIYLIPEFVKLTGVPGNLKSKPREISKYTRRMPNESMNAIQKHCERINEFSKELKNETVTRFSFNFETKLTAAQLKRKYDEFKKYCCVEKPIPSQVVCQSSLSPEKIRSVATGIMKQVNVKLGSSLWSVICSDVLPNKNVMFIGADVYHNTQNKKQSVVGVCASFDSENTKYYSRVKLQNKGVEVMETIGSLVEDCLKNYFSKNKKLPETIIFYRDGVGDSQYNWVTDFEIPSILNAFGRIDPNYKPKFCEILINKRLNERFFTSYNQKSYENPPAGTWVYDEVVSRTYHDFYLCAQNFSQGTATPTHYTVIYDGLGLKQDSLAALTFYQCFNYFNWTGAIRVPACAQYAHKLAYLVGENLGREFDRSLSGSMFFL